MKAIVYLSLAICLGISVPQKVYADAPYVAEMTQDEEVRISVSGRNIRIQFAVGETLEIYDITGAKVGSYRIDSADKTINVILPKGYYILKVGKRAVRKVSIV